VANGHENWLLIEKIPGVELWQVGELSVWEAVATWLGRFHARFASEIRALRADNPHLLDHSKEWFRSWADRAGAALGQSDDSRAAIVRRGLTRYDGIAGSLAALPRTFVHGELYPSNVLVVTTSQPLGIFPVDWEMAAIGPGLIDLAALSGGWARDEQRRLEEAYFAGLPDDAAESANVDEAITRCRLHLALQWLGWSSNWTPPIEHRHDWIGEAHSLMGELGIV
jgi:thiamine kinase-like enzyme